ncbi:mitochondrial carrier domain-containing protein [Mortierella sp. GBAus27b]|nr:hypothetical protein BGX31_008603 [Mortierella sp. GBA43]KAI8362109.1 mitochondrial carrier domain-containing protein [Mortierella sp. GBAus27b]
MPPGSPLDPSKIDFQKYYFYGTVLNVPPILLMYPMRTVRLLQQRRSSVPVSSSIFKVIKDVHQKNGFRALYAGATVFSLGLTTTKIVQFATYDYLSQKTRENDYFGVEALKNPTLLSGMLGTASSVVTTLFVVPFDMVSQQITIAKAGAHGNVATVPGSTTATCVAPAIVPEAAGTAAAVHPSQMPIGEALKLQIKQEGVRFLFRGYVATLMAAIPFFAAYFPAYEVSRVWVKDGIEYVRSRQPNSPSPFPASEWHQLIISSVAGSMASLAGVLVSSPSDMVKTRIQTEQRLQPMNGSGPKAPMPSLKWMDVFMEIWRKEGFRKFFSGTKARAILAVPGGALNFIIFDFVRSISTKTEPVVALSQIVVSPERAKEALY